jgi:hypothetical protein
MKTSIRRPYACRRCERISCSYSTNSKERRLRRRRRKRKCLKRAARHLMNQWLIGEPRGNLEIDYSLIKGRNRKFRKKIT